MTQWFKDHATAILATAFAVGKAGLLGKGVSALIVAIAAALST